MTGGGISIRTFDIQGSSGRKHSSGLKQCSAVTKLSAEPYK